MFETMEEYLKWSGIDQVDWSEVEAREWAYVERENESEVGGTNDAPPHGSEAPDWSPWWHTMDVEFWN